MSSGRKPFALRPRSFMAHFFERPKKRAAKKIARHTALRLALRFATLNKSELASTARSNNDLFIPRRPLRAQDDEPRKAGGTGSQTRSSNRRVHSKAVSALAKIGAARDREAERPISSLHRKLAAPVRRGNSPCLKPRSDTPECDSQARREVEFGEFQRSETDPQPIFGRP